MELERKLHLTQLPTGLGKPEPVTQAYLYTDHFELRVRRKAGKCTLTYKSLEPVEREEWEKEIPCWLFDELLTKHVGSVIEKNRYTLMRDGYRYEIDEYITPQRGLIIAEIEFKNRIQYNAFKPPTWLGETLDVTLDPRYKNRNLATNPEPHMKL